MGRRIKIIMTKELEAFEEIKKYLVNLKFHFLEEELDTIETALKNYQKLSKDYSIVVDEKIELAVMCAKEHEALRIIVEKDVNLADIRCCATVEQYNVKENGNIPLTRKEFNLLKEVTL